MFQLYQDGLKKKPSFFYACVELVLCSFIAGFLLATFIFLTGMTGRFFKERKKRKEEKIRLKTALPEKKKLSGLPHYDE